MLKDLQTMKRWVLTSAPFVDSLCSGLCLLGNGVIRSHGEATGVLMRGRGGADGNEV